MSTPTEPGTGLEPGMYYNVTAQCANPECPLYNQVTSFTEVYSNGGDITNAIWCGRSGNFMQILTTELMDPQPVIPVE